MQDRTFSLEAFERAAYLRNHEDAARELNRLLNLLNQNLGATNRFLLGEPTTLVDGEAQERHLLTRLASAITAVFSDPDFFLTDNGYSQLISLHRWLALIFAVSPFHNADHIIRLFNQADPANGGLEIEARAMSKLVMLFSPESELPLDLGALWQVDRRMAACLAFALISPRFIASNAAHGKRELLLEWLPRHLDEVEELAHLPLGILHDVYMHCSYADLPQRHAIKRPINRLVRKTLQAQGLTDRLDAGHADVDGKPVLMVVLEWFTADHSMFRCFSRSIEGLRTRFHVIGVGAPHCVDEITTQVFDRFLPIDINLPMSDIATVRALAETHRPAVVYMPSVGMFPLTVFLSNLRLAPLQLMGCGHPATTHAPCIDHVLVEAYYRGDPACFSEAVVVVPDGTMPFRRAKSTINVLPMIRNAPSPVRIAVTASPMKINPRFLEACRSIAEHSAVKVEFHWMMGIAQGLVQIQARDQIRAYLPDAVVLGQQPYADYLRHLATCDMYVNPFPFGNTNGLVDTTLLGLAGVCKTGPEVFERIDGGIFHRIGLPGELVAHSVPEYVSAAIRLAEDHEWRNALRRDLLARDAVQRLFEGDDHQLGEQIAALMAR